MFFELPNKKLILLLLYLWNYNSGNIVLVTNEGVYYIKREEVLFMRPIKPFDIEGIEEKEQT